MKLKTAMKLLRNWEEWTGENGTWREVKLTDTEGEEIAQMLNKIAYCGNCRYDRGCKINHTAIEKQDESCPLWVSAK